MVVKSSRSLTRGGALAIGAVLLAATLSADSRVEFKAAEGSAGIETILIGSGKVRIDQGKNMSILIDPKTKTMMSLHHDKKEFIRFGDAEVEQLAKDWQEGIDAMKELIASLPDEMRPDMEALLKTMLNPGEELKVVEAGESTVAGKPCRVYRTTIKDVVVSEDCVSDIAALNLAPADRDTLTAAMSVAQSVAAEITKFMAPPIADQLLPFKSNMVILRSTRVMSERPDRPGERSTSEFVRVTTDALSPDLFTVPATYKEGKIDGDSGRVVRR